MQEVPVEFDPRRMATSRHYMYRLYTKDDAFAVVQKNYHFAYATPINKEIFDECLAMMIGKKDFASFTAREKYESTEREIMET